VLGLEAGDEPPEAAEGLHLYQEIAPVHPLVVSSLGPRQFYELIVKSPSSLLRLPAICFVDLRLGELADDPRNGSIGSLPYSRTGHLRQCLMALATKRVAAKMVNRTEPATFPYRTIKNGIFVGNEAELRFFPLPPPDRLRAENYRWWRSAEMACL
jgi:hypothetical protein